MSYVKLTAKNNSNAITELKCNESGSINIDGSAVTQPISASSLPLPTGASTLSEQQTQSSSLSTIAGYTESIDDKLPTTLGQTTKASSLSVTIASDDTINIDGSAVTQPISASSLPLPTGAATLTEQQTQSTSLSTIAGDTTSIDGKLPTTLGQTTKASSLSVTIASDDTVAVSDSTAQSSLSTIAGDTTNIDDKLQTLQNKIDDVADNLKNLFSYIMYNDIRYLRGNLTGRAYMASYYFYSTSDLYNIASIYNPNNLQQIYVYKIDWHIDNDNDGDIKTSLRLQRHEGHTDGSNVIPRNLKLNSGDYSGNVEFKKGSTSYTNEVSLCYLAFGDSPGEYRGTLDLKNDMIEISGGNGIAVDYNLTTNSTNNKCRGFITYFFIEKSLEQKLPTEYIPI
jgi:hypothetical protein